MQSANQTKERAVYKKICAALIAGNFAALNDTLNKNQSDPEALVDVMALLERDLGSLQFKLHYLVGQVSLKNEAGSLEAIPAGLLIIDSDDGSQMLFWTDRRLADCGADAMVHPGSAGAPPALSPAPGDAAASPQPRKAQPGTSPSSLSNREKITGYLGKGTVAERSTASGHDVLARDEDGNDVFLLRFGTDGKPFYYWRRDGAEFRSSDGGKTWTCGGVSHRFSLELNRERDLIRRDSESLVVSTYKADGSVISENLSNFQRKIQTADGFLITDQRSTDGGRQVLAQDRFGRMSFFIWYNSSGLPYFYHDRDGDWSPGSDGKTWTNALGQTRDESVSIDDAGNLLLNSADGIRQWTQRPDGTEVYRNNEAGYHRITRADGSSVWEEFQPRSNRKITAYDRNKVLLYSIEFDEANRPQRWQERDNVWQSGDGGNTWKNEKGQSRTERIFIDRKGNLIVASADGARTWTTEPDGTLLHKNREAGYSRITKADGSAILEETKPGEGRRITSYDAAQRKLFTLCFGPENQPYRLDEKNGTWDRATANKWQHRVSNEQFDGMVYIDREGNLVKASTTVRFVSRLDGDEVEEDLASKSLIIRKPDSSTVRVLQMDNGRELIGLDSGGKEIYAVLLGADGKIVRSRDKHGTWLHTAEDSWKRESDGKPWTGTIEIDKHGNYVEITAKGMRTILASGRSITGRFELNESTRQTNFAATTQVNAGGTNARAKTRVVTNANGLLESCVDKSNNKRIFQYNNDACLVACIDTDADGNELQTHEFASCKSVDVDSLTGDVSIELDERSSCIMKLGGTELWFQDDTLDMYKRADGACRWYHYSNGQLYGFDGYDSAGNDVGKEGMTEFDNVNIDRNTGDVLFTDKDGRSWKFTLDGEQKNYQSSVEKVCPE